MSDRCEPPPEGFEMVGCCVQNSAPPDLVRELVEALEGVVAGNRRRAAGPCWETGVDLPETWPEKTFPTDEALSAARAALRRAKEAGV